MKASRRKPLMVVVECMAFVALSCMSGCLEQRQPSAAKANLLPDHHEKALAFQAAKRADERSDLTLIEIPRGKSGEQSFTSFWISKYELTKGDFARFLLETGYKSHAQEAGFDASAMLESHLPMTDLVSEDEALYLCWAGMQIPRCEEWRRAATGPENLVFPWGNDPGPVLGYREAKSAWLRAEKDAGREVSEKSYLIEVEAASDIGDVGVYGVVGMMTNGIEECFDIEMGWPAGLGFDNPDEGIRDKRFLYMYEHGDFDSRTCAVTLRPIRLHDDDYYDAWMPESEEPSGREILAANALREFWEQLGRNAVAFYIEENQHMPQEAGDLLDHSTVFWLPKGCKAVRIERMLAGSRDGMMMTFSFEDREKRVFLDPKNDYERMLSQRRPYPQWTNENDFGMDFSQAVSAALRAFVIANGEVPTFAQLDRWIGERNPAAWESVCIHGGLKPSTNGAPGTFKYEVSGTTVVLTTYYKRFDPVVHEKELDRFLLK